MDMDQDLLGWWKLAGDETDSGPARLDTLNHGVEFVAADCPGGRAARFDGAGAHLEVPMKAGMGLADGDFTLAAWIRTPEGRDLGRALGDIASKYRPLDRRGFNLSIMNYPGVVYSQPNWRNLHFGIDNGRVEEDWTDCGRPGAALHVFSMAVWEGALYVGTFETDGPGHVWKYCGGTDWLDCGSPDDSNTVMSLAVYDGALHAATGRYRAEGSALPASVNQTEGGRVFRYLGDGVWEEIGRLDDRAEAHSLTVHQDVLYAIPSYTPGVFRYTGGRWEECGVPGDRRSMNLTAFDGYLYSLGNEYAGVWRHMGGDEWIERGLQYAGDVDEDGNPRNESQIYSFASYLGCMHVGTWPSGSVMRYDGRGNWMTTGRLGEEREVMGMLVYNGKLYAGTLPLAQVYRYDAPGGWTLVGRVDHTPDATYRRAWSMAVWRGALYCGTLPSGHVWRMEAGINATHDRELEAGWRHVAAVREGDRLKLYVDGRMVASSRQFDPSSYDLSNDEPLLIGYGAHHSFTGDMRDVRLYGRALSPREAASLAENA